ncbi:MAG TPA: DUF882 domain-containing protein [Candidatus Sulfotelmatobacter sp.]|jgi:uncharacterized protein YcbK (DUF882 family)|nr:DUF882 domain-containing protein [Candidatus Sulfotelmatobacter sp.]
MPDAKSRQHPSRRAVLGGLAGLTAALLAGSAQARPRARIINVVNAHTGARFKGIYAVDQDYFKGPLEGFSEIAKDFHANQTHRMHPATLDIIWIYQTILGLDEAVLLSGYRTPHTNANLEGAARHSFHMRGMALDLMVPGRHSVASVGDEMRRFIGGGIGLYHARDFVHLDVGPQRDWVG